MTNNDILNTIRSFFSKIYELGSNIYIYDDGPTKVSLNNFLLVITLMLIVLSALVSYVRVHGSTQSVNQMQSIGRGVRSRFNKRGIVSDDFGTSRGRWRG